MGAIDVCSYSITNLSAAPCCTCCLCNRPRRSTVASWYDQSTTGHIPLTLTVLVQNRTHFAPQPLPPRHSDLKEPFASILLNSAFLTTEFIVTSEMACKNQAEVPCVTAVSRHSIYQMGQSYGRKGSPPMMDSTNSN